MKSVLKPGIPIRGLFPLLARKRSDGRPLVYFDNAATSLKPQCVIDAVVKVLSEHTSNVHRSVHQLGDEVTNLYERARRKIANFIGANENEIVFLKNATEALNLVARSWKQQSRILTTLGEHHSNFLPWTGNVTRLRPLPNGTLDWESLERELKKGDVEMVTLSSISNVTGASINAKKIAQIIHDAGAVLVLDATQAVPHHKINVREINCDFLAFSGHKMCGPTGIGVLYGKAEHLMKMDPFLVGGETVKEVHSDSFDFLAPPRKFEAGTPPIESVIGLGAAVDFLELVGIEAIQEYQESLTQYAIKKIIQMLPTARILGPLDENHLGPVSLTFEGISSHMLARTLSDAYGICLRSGFHCAQPLHETLQSPPTLRASFYLYNTTDEIDYFISALTEIISRVSR